MDTDAEFAGHNESRASSAPIVSPGEVLIGTLTDLTHEGIPLVDFPGKPSDQLYEAMTTVAVSKQHIGRQVVLLFSSGDTKKPVIMGLIHSPLDALIDNFEENVSQAATLEMQQSMKLQDATLNGERIVLEGKEEIVLKCGEASITLTKAGKILIRGKYLLNRSSGVNRIMGGSVQVN